MEDHLRVLVVEDVPSDAELVSRQLNKAGLPHVVRRVETREEFVSAVKSFNPDIILSDYRLPQFDGMAALALAKKLAQSTPFIVVTGSVNEETAVECMKAGASDYVLKEGIVRLGSAVRGALVRQRTLEEKQKAEAEVLRQAEDLRRSNRELEQFALIAAHDIREPLRKIVTLGDLILSRYRGDLDEVGQDYLQRMQS